jgi:hypothetical protein
MLGWLKKWRKSPEDQIRSTEERKAHWEERSRQERAFLDRLEQKLAANFPSPEPAPPDPTALAAERFKTERPPREPHFGEPHFAEIERFPRRGSDGSDRQPLLPELLPDAPPPPPSSPPPPPPEEPLIQYADRYQKLQADLRTAATTPAANGQHAAVERRPRDRRPLPSAAPQPAALNVMLRAALFAADRHKNQRRKGVAREPYINHLLEVAALLSDATDGEDMELIIAGLLHEAMEDQDGVDEIAVRFGAGVTALVAELADDRRRGMSEPRHSVLEPPRSRRAQMIKIAELISHVRALHVSPPTDWTLERRRDYFLWAQRMVAGCRDASPELETVFDAACSRGLEALKHLH